MSFSGVIPGGIKIGPSICRLIVKTQRAVASLRATHGWHSDPGSQTSAREGSIVTQQRPSKQNDALPETPTVLVVDDDPEVRDALSSLFRSVGLNSRLFASTAESVLQKLPELPCCIVLDIRLPGWAASTSRLSWPGRIFASPLS